EQLEYCKIHRAHSNNPISLPTETEDGFEGMMDARRMKTLLYCSVTPLFSQLHKRIGQSATHARKLRKYLAQDKSGGLSFFLKNTHDRSDFHYHVPTNRVDRALELLNISPALRYLCK